VVGRVGILGLLRRHIVAGTHHLLAGGQPLGTGSLCHAAGLVDAGQAHIEHLDRTFAVHQQVARLDVAMHHAVLVATIKVPSGEYSAQCQSSTGAVPNCLPELKSQTVQAPPSAEPQSKSAIVDPPGEKAARD